LEAPPLSLSVRSFAEQVLTGTSLEDKFLSPENLVDDGLPFQGVFPELPGRPHSLKFSRGGPSPELNRLKKVESDQDRGELLHLFANHELLAIELMALCLLRFHDAPPAFRRQVITTLADEQRHAQAYLARMKACGVNLGERPVNGTFWNHLRHMSSIEDYCSGMALTLEQANLDFALHFEARFREAGDELTANLLHEVRIDEIFHVRVGVQHMKGQLEDGQDLWDLWSQHLSPPLSPSRAKAYEMDLEGRREAGLDDRFISKLKRYERSKGRPPRVFLFNGLAEEEALGGEPSLQRKAMNRDFQSAMHLLAHNDDLVVVDQHPSSTFLDYLKETGFTRPEWRLNSEGPLNVGHQKVGSLHPWAWNKNSWQKLKATWPLQTLVDVSAWSPSQLISKDTCHLTKSDLSFLPPSEFHQPSLKIDHVDALVSHLEAHPHDHLLKMPLSASGHGHLPLSFNSTMGFKKVEKALKRHRELIVEPLHHRLADFSHPAHFDGEKIRWIGTTRMLIDANGKYQGAWLGNAMDGLNPETRRFLHDQKGQPIWAELHRSWETHLIQYFKELKYKGPFSIDAYLHQKADATQPNYRGCCEINLRSTFGHLALSLQNSLRKGCRALMSFVPMTDWEALPSLKELSLTREGEPHCWKRGLFPINDLWQAEKVALILVAGETSKEVHSLLKSMRVERSSHIHEGFDSLWDHQ